jgi:hypothetical protein
MKIKHTLKNETMKLSHFNENHVLGSIVLHATNDNVECGILYRHEKKELIYNTLNES